MTYGLFALVLFVALQAYVRLAPSDVARWHVDPFEASHPQKRGSLKQFETTSPAATALSHFEQVAAATDRTQLLAGGIDEGRMTFVTRSRFWGFPDYTTIGVRESQAGSEVAVLARARFGGNDWGVNAARIRTWRAATGN